jgi:hypothetical protein
VTSATGYGAAGGWTYAARIGVEGAQRRKELNTVNATAANGVARAAAIVLVLVLAAAAGLAVGNLIQQVTGDRSPTDLARPLEGLAALQENRGSESQAYADYGIRHAPAAAAFQDYGLRHITAAAATAPTTESEWMDYGQRHIDAAAGTQVAPALTSDTFRLTGPSQVEDGAPTSDTFRLTGPSDVDEPEFLRSRAN